MTQLQQRRWFKKKTVTIVDECDITVAQRCFWRQQTERYGLLDVHPFYESYKNTGVGYLIGVLVCGLLTLSTSLLYGDVPYGAWVTAGYAACTGVVAVLFCIGRVAKLEFFHRATGKPIFFLWKRKKDDAQVQQFAQHLVQRVRDLDVGRFAMARSIVNRTVRHSVAEEAVYQLYRQGLLDFSEMETLLINVEKNYKPAGSLLAQSEVENTDNVIDFTAYMKERLSE